ncbi:MAG: hypothetical protein OHK0038_10800 [Flammeovirgaceae bacterium]
MPKKISIVVGLGFGDEGKGLATDYLSFKSLHYQENTLVIRFNGGQQAGHTVVTGEGKRHVFSNFGSGTLRGFPTYWSKYCTFSPASYLKEFQAITLLGVIPILFVDKLCAITTHYDVLYNRRMELSRGDARHGSCGMGFGATIERQQLTPYKLYAQDLLFPELCAIKLKAIRKYYQSKFEKETTIDFQQFDHSSEDELFISCIESLQSFQKNHVLKFVNEPEILQLAEYQHFIFEGAQGILLDMDFGFFPHVTRSNTTSKNAIELIRNYFPHLLKDTQLYYVTRAYQTRHGAGNMTHENEKLILKNNEKETNQFNDYQGVFRVSPLDLDLLNYSLLCDQNFSYGLNKNLLVTCLDQVDSQGVNCYFENQKQHIFYQKIPSFLAASFQKVMYSFSDCGEKII